jgi:DNA-binding SARP family transcriptional activator
MRLVMNTPGSAGPRSAAAPASARLLLRAAGQLALQGRAAIDLEPKDALLLAYLAIEGPTPRGRLASLLWPDVDDERARGNLRQRLLRLKRTTGVELVTGNPLAQLAPGIEHDLTDTRELLSSIEPHQAAGLAEWLEAQRSRRHRSHADWLDAACTQAEAEGDLAAALEHANALVQLDPLSEHAHRRVMKLHYLRGDTAAAMAAYERCRQTLKRELNAAPSKETEALRAGVGSALVTAPVASAHRTVPPSVLRPPRLVGREAEWAALERAREAHQPALVLGEAGMGKTRLVSDFARAHGAAAIASARPGDERIVYALATRLLRQLPRETLAELDAPVRKELARLLPELGEAAPISSEAERARFYNAVAAALEAATGAIDAVVIDDLHFADEASVELLQYLAADSRVCWLFAARPAEIGPQVQAWLAALRARPGSFVLEVAPLALAQLAELIDSLGIDGLSGAEHAQALLRATGGNPLFVLETVRAWWTQRDDGGPARLLPVAASVGGIVQRRIGRLSPDAIKLARCAAVAGQDFCAELAAHVLGVRPLDLADAWAELEHANVFRDGAFAHDLIYEAALASVPPPIARELHAQIAALLAQRNTAPARLAEHWLAAGQQREALTALVAAAESARHQNLRLAEAAEHYERASAIAQQLGDSDACFEALVAQLDTLVSLDRDRLDDRLIERLQAHATTPHRQARALAMHAQILLHRGRHAEAIAQAQRAAELARAAGDEDLAASSLSDAAAAASQSGDAERAVRMLRPLLPWALEHASDETRINLLGHLGLCLDNVDHQAEAQAVHRRAIEAAMRANRFDQAVAAWGNLAISLLDVGKPRAALEAIAQARSVAANYDALKGNAFSLGLFEGVAALALRRYRAALGAFDGALGDVAHNALAAAAVRMHRACLWLHLGQYARAQRELELPAATQPLPGWVEARRQQMMGRCDWCSDRKDAAARHWQAAAAAAPTTERAVLAAMIALDHALVRPAATALASVRGVLARAERLGHFGTALAARVRLAALALQHGELDAALQAVDALAQVPEDVEPNDLYAGERWLVTVRVLRAADRHDEAVRALKDAVAAIERIAREDTPPEFRDSFLHRNPVNRELLTLATRLK